MNEQALTGVKVLEIAEMTAGPYCGKLLADMGAEVIKIERPDTGDPIRMQGPFPENTPNQEKSGLHIFTNCNKKGVTLDLTQTEGLDLFKRMIKWADILISDKQPVELDALGIDYSKLIEINPKLVITSVTPFGLTGPQRNYKSSNMSVAHAGGHAFLLPRFSTEPDRPPVKPGGSVTSYDSGMGAKVATLAALFYQQMTGKGQIVDVSEQEIQIDMQRVESVCTANGGISINRFRQKHLAGVGGNFICSDGVVCALPAMPNQWELFKQMLDSPLLTDNPKAADMASAYQHADEIREIANDLTSKEKKWDLTMRGQAIKFPITPILEADEVVESKQLADREFFQKVDHPEVGTIEKFPGASYKMSETPWQYLRPAPRLGEHNEEVFTNHMAMSLSEIEALKQKGII